MKGKVKVIVDGVPYEVEVEELGVGKFKVNFEGESYEANLQPENTSFSFNSQGCSLFTCFD